jgi:DNA repair exonuclease SbcCD ATPase subunit
MISIKSIEWRNFLGYGDYISKIDLDKNKGISLIVGEFEEERDEGDEKKCGSGKTTIIEAVVWCLFGNLTYKEQVGDMVINWSIGKNCIVKITTNDGYEIIRTRKYNNCDDLIILKDGVACDTRGTTTLTQDYLNNLFNIDYKTFCTSVVFGQFCEGFLSISDNKRRKILERIMRLISFNSVAKSAKETIQNIDKDIESLKSKINDLETTKLEVDKNITKYIDKVKEFENDKNDKINKMKVELCNKKSDLMSKTELFRLQISEITNILQSHKEINFDKIKNEWLNYNSVLLSYNDYDRKLNKLNDDIISLNNLIKSKEDNLHSILSTIKEMKDDIKGEWDKEWDSYNKNKDILSNLQDELSLISNEQTIYKHDISNTNKELYIINNLKIAKCDKCFNDISKEHIEIKKAEKEKIINDLSKKLESIDFKSAPIKNKILELQNLSTPKYTIQQIKEKELKISELSNKYKILATEILNFKNDLKQLNINKESCTKEISKIQLPDKPLISLDDANKQTQKINELKNQIKEYENKIISIDNEFKLLVTMQSDNIKSIKTKENPFHEMVIDNKNSYDKISKEIVEINTKISQKNILRTHLEYIKSSYSDKKLMKAFWISQLIPDLNKLIKYYLDFFESPDIVEFDEFLNYKTNRWDYTTHSGGEKKRIDISMMFALNDLHVKYFGQQCNLLVLDEVDGRIDPFTINKLVSLLSDDIINREGLTNIFVVSHREKMNDRFPHKIRVKNNGEHAYIST